jgi:3-hydroxyisobutyrate dehydrogenase
MTTVAVLGVGSMGGRIARRILEGGHRTLVWNRTSGRAAPLVQEGAIAVPSPAHAANDAEVVITMVADPPALRDISEGPGGLVAGAREGLLVIEMSTVGPEAVRRLRSVLPADAGVVDAPVLGSLAEAESGALTIYVGGSPGDTERAWPLLSLLGTPIRTGAVGTGAAAKLIANMALFGALGLLGESIALARALGLGADVAFDVLGTTPLAGQTNRRRASIEAGDYPPRFALALAAKDSKLIGSAADAVGLRLPVGRASCSWFADAASAGRGSADYTSVLAYIIEHGGGSGS